MKYLKKDKDRELTSIDWIIVFALAIGMIGAVLGIGTIIFYIKHLIFS